MARRPIVPPKPASKAKGSEAAARSAATSSAAAERVAAERDAAEKAAAGKRAPEGPAAERLASGTASIRAATAGVFREAVAFARPAAADAGGVAVPLSDYLSLLRREIARAGVEAAPEGDQPLVSFAEAEISLACVALAIENDRLIVDPSWKALAEAPEAAVQRLKLRLVDADMIAAGRAKE